MIDFRCLIGLCVCLSVLAAGCRLSGVDAEVSVPPSDATSILRPTNWAHPLQQPGLTNLFQVNAGLFRGAQPSAEGMRSLEAMKIKTVVSLRGFNDDDEELFGTALKHERIHFKTWHAEDEDVVRFLRIVTDPEQQPVFVHCQHGSDRTGTMCAIYRIVVQGWSKDDAIREMTDGGFGFHPIWFNLISYIRDADIEKFRREAGIPAANK